MLIKKKIYLHLEFSQIFWREMITSNLIFETHKFLHFPKPGRFQ